MMTTGSESGTRIRIRERKYQVVVHERHVRDEGYHVVELVLEVHDQHGVERIY